MYTTFSQPRLLTLALLIGLYGCASHHRTTRESTTEGHTTSDLQRTLHTTHQEHALDTLTLDLTEIVQLLPPHADTTASKNEGRRLGSALSPPTDRASSGDHHGRSTGGR